MFERFKTAGALMFSSGLNDSHGGNMSVRQDGSMLITSRMSMTADLNPEDIIEISIDNETEKDGLASRDLVMHRMLYRNTGAKAVMHAHLPNALALCVTENKILPQDSKGQYYFPQGVSIIKPRQGAEREEIAKLLLGSLSGTKAAVMVKGYGSFVIAPSIEEALEITTSLEISSKIWLMSKLVQAKQQPVQQQGGYEHRKRSAIPPAIGVMGRRTGTFGRRDMKR